MQPSMRNPAVRQTISSVLYLFPDKRYLAHQEDLKKIELCAKSAKETGGKSEETKARDM